MAEAGPKRLLNQAVRGGALGGRRVGRGLKSGELPQSRLRKAASVLGGTASVVKRRGGTHAGPGWELRWCPRAWAWPHR